MDSSSSNTGLRPKMFIVFVAAFVAGGTGAVVVNQSIDVARSRSQPSMECEPIFVALRDLPAGSPVTVWDVKLRDWPKAMVPQSALRADSFEGLPWPENHVTRMTLREGQPVLRGHLQAMLARPSPGSGEAAPVVAVSRPADLGHTVSAEKLPAEKLPAEDLAAETRPVRPETEPSPPAPTPAQTVSTGSPVTDAAATVEASADPSATVQTEVDPAAEAHVAHDWRPHEQPVEEPIGHGAEHSVTATGTISGEGWPSLAETVVGGEASMRFLVVPERIAIMADELTSPPGIAAATSPTASVAAQPRRSTTRAAQSDRSGSREPSVKSTAKSNPPARQPQQQGGTPARRTPDSPAIRPRPSPIPSNRTTSNMDGSQRQPNGGPSARTAAAGTPRVRVEPDPESERADEDARTPVLKSMLPTMFPSMAAGIEKFETEMARIRRERFGGLFQSAADQRAADQADPADRSRTGGR